MPDNYQKAVLPQISLAVVGADYPNNRAPSRRFELAICRPGERVDLVPEPKNKADRRAIAVFSERGIQIGYLSAERCGRIGALIRQGHELKAIYQATTGYGAIIRVAFDGHDPTLPPQREPPSEPQEWWPDEEWGDSSQ